MLPKIPWQKLPGVRVTLAQRTRHSDYWSERNREPVPEGACRYLALGDSLAIGVGLDDVQLGYVPLIGRRLEAALDRPVHITNIAASGSTIDDVLHRQIPQVSEHEDAEIVTCAVGGNDVAWARRFDVERFRASAHRLAEALPAGSVMGLVPSFWHPTFEARVRLANEALTEAAEANGLAVADIFTATKAQSFATRFRNLGADGFHPNAGGYALWAGALWSALEPRIESLAVGSRRNSAAS